MAAASTDKFKKLARRWVGQVGSGSIADAVVTTVPLSSVTNLPTDTGVVVVVDRVDASGVATPQYEETIYGVVSGTNLVTCTRGVEGTAQGHSAGAVVEVLFVAKSWNDVIDGLLVEHGQDGKHTKVNGNTVPAGTDTVTLNTASQTLTNKTLTKPIFTGSVQVVTAMAAQALNGALGNVFTRTLAASETFTQSNFTTGQCFLVKVKQGSGTSYTVTWFSGITWITSGATAPTQTTTTNGYTAYGFVCTGSNTFDGYLEGTQ